MNLNKISDKKPSWSIGDEYPTTFLGKTARQLLPLASLVGYCMLCAWCFYLMQMYGDHVALEIFEVLTPYSDFNEQNCVDAGNVSFAKASYFMGTVFSTIGYGDIVPCTLAGKLCTIVFALTGVPLTLVCLATLGRMLREIGDGFWSSYRLKRDSDHDAEKSKQTSMPLLIGIFITVVWIFASTYYIWKYMFEEWAIPSSWTFFDSLYFMLSSILTIGFGDFTPNHRDGIVFLLIFVGLALLSMCVAILQKSMETQFDRIVTVVQEVYRKQSAMKMPSNGKPASASSGSLMPPLAAASAAAGGLTEQEEAMVAAILETWKDAVQSRVSPPKSPSPGPFVQQLMTDKWKKKTLTRTIATQANIAPSDNHSGLKESARENEAKVGQYPFLEPSKFDRKSAFSFR